MRGDHRRRPIPKESLGTKLRREVAANPSCCSPIALVAVLFTRTRPTAIARLVVAVHVDAIECHTFGALAHVSEEVIERLPTRIDRNSATTVVVVARCRRVTTPLPHVDPRAARRCVVLC